MTLEEVRKEIDQVDSQMKPLFLSRMVCARHVAEAKAVTGADVFVPAREDEIIEMRTADVDPDVKQEYEMFLRHLMSVSRRYQYGMLPGMQDQVIKNALNEAGLDGNADHEQVMVSFTDSRKKSNLNLFLNMIRLNGILIDEMTVKGAADCQQVVLALHGNVNQPDMRRLLCQIGKEAKEFRITALGNSVA